MTRSHRPTDFATRLLSFARPVILGAVALVLASAVQAGGYLDESEPSTAEKPTWAVPAKRMAVEGDDASALVAELHNAKLRVTEAQQNETTAKWNYSRARNRNYPRGEEFVEIRTRYADSTKEREEAEQSFLELVDRAHQAGVAAGTLSPYVDLAEEIQSQQTDEADSE